MEYPLLTSYSAQYGSALCRDPVRLSGQRPIYVTVPGEAVASIHGKPGSACIPVLHSLMAREFPRLAGSLTGIRSGRLCRWRWTAAHCTNRSMHSRSTLVQLAKPYAQVGCGVTH